jgi:hypothetical protein
LIATRLPCVELWTTSGVDPALELAEAEAEADRDVEVAVELSVAMMANGFVELDAAADEEGASDALLQVHVEVIDDEEGAAEEDGATHVEVEVGATQVEVDVGGGGVQVEVGGGASELGGGVQAGDGSTHCEVVVAGAGESSPSNHQVSWMTPTDSSAKRVKSCD